MKEKQYKNYCLKLQEHGFQYKKDQPYEGGNLWYRPIGRNLEWNARLTFTVYDYLQSDENPRIEVAGRGCILFSDGCQCRLDINFGTYPDPAYAVGKMEEILRKLGLKEDLGE